VAGMDWSSGHLVDQLSRELFLCSIPKHQFSFGGLVKDSISWWKVSSI
jgi:hypothetical protein